LEASAQLWQTPQQPKGGGTGRSGERIGEPLLDGQARMWRTPAGQEPGVTPERLEGGDGHRAYDKETGRLAQYGLTQQSQMWPTAQAADGEKMSHARREGDATLPSASKNFQSSLPAPQTSTPGGKSSKSRRRLNPLFVEWLMGWGRGSSACGCSEMASSHYKQRMRSSLSTLLSRMTPGAPGLEKGDSHE